MRTAEEWAEYITEHVDEFLDTPVDSMVNPAKIYRAIQADAIKACAEKAFGVGRAMADGYKDTSCPHCNDGQVAAGNTGLLTRENILSLLPKDTP